MLHGQARNHPIKLIFIRQIASLTALLFLTRVKAFPDAFSGLLGTQAGDLLRYMSSGVTNGILSFETGAKATKGFQNKVRYQTQRPAS